jgi:hypothetical protein
MVRCYRLRYRLRFEIPMLNPSRRNRVLGKKLRLHFLIEIYVKMYYKPTKIEYEGLKFLIMSAPVDSLMK